MCLLPAENYLFQLPVYYPPWNNSANANQCHHCQQMAHKVDCAPASGKSKKIEENRRKIKRNIELGESKRIHKPTIDVLIPDQGEVVQLFMVPRNDWVTSQPSHFWAARVL